MPRHALVLPPLSPALAPARRQHHLGNRHVELPRLSVVIVNYCQWESTFALVKQILRSSAARRGAVEVVVIDNHSPGHPLATRLRRLPGVSFRRWGRNRGFASAVNEGCRLSRGRWFLLLNPDLTMTEGFLDGILALADQVTDDDPRAGIVGFQLLNGDGSRQLSSGYFPTLPGTLAGLMLPRSRRKYRSLRVRQRCQVPWVTGCCLLLRRSCVQELGGLDESYFLYYEDVDLCRRAQAQGWSVWYEPGLRAVHHDPSHRRAVPPALRLIARHSLLTYGFRHWPRWQFKLLSGIVRLEAAARRQWARWCGDRRSADIFATMGRLAIDLRNGNPIAARRRLDAIVRAGDPRGY